MRLIFGKGKVSNIISRDGDTVLSRNDCDISDIDSASRVLKNTHADTIINCAAKTNLEYCQENKIESFESNTLGVLNLIALCSDFNKKLVHISSGCLFDGNEFISDENADPSPAVWYTWTKTWADEVIQNHGYKNYLILRPRQLISKTPHPSNMLTKFAAMDRIPAIEEENSLTCIEDFGEMIDHLLYENHRGVFNCCNSGTVTPYEIAIKIKETINKNLIVEKASYDDLLTSLPNRRVNTILSCEKLISTGYMPRSAKEALAWCLLNYGE